VILLKDLPNILHPQVAASFHSTLQSFLAREAVGVPIVIVVSDAGVRGEDTGEEGWKGKKEVK
jgi:cell cycle checkpoint protein